MKRSEKISGNEKKRKGKLFHVEMGEEGRKKKKLYPLIGTAIIHIHNRSIFRTNYVKVTTNSFKIQPQFKCVIYLTSSTYCHSVSYLWGWLRLPLTCILQNRHAIAACCCHCHCSHIYTQCKRKKTRIFSYFRLLVLAMCLWKFT